MAKNKLFPLPGRRPAQMQGPGQVPIQINVDKCEDLTCEDCGGEFFDTVYKIKAVSPIISPTGKEEKLAMPMFRCANPDCRKVTKVMKK